MTDTLIATIKKNAREEIRVVLSTFNGRRLFNARVWYEAESGEMRPGKSGIAFKADKLPDFADVVSLALEKARAEGACE